jgi:hypothetical protein
MVDKTKLYESLSALIDAVTSENEEAESQLMSKIAKAKTQEILEGKTEIKEFSGDSRIKMNGDDVFIDDKKVGTIKSDADDMTSGMVFTSADGDSKEFDTIEQIYGHIATKYNVKESEELDESSPEESKKVAVDATEAGKSERSKRWAEINKPQKDGTQGDHTSQTGGVYDTPNDKGVDPKADASDLDTDLTYDSKDVRTLHNKD